MIQRCFVHHIVTVYTILSVTWESEMLKRHSAVVNPHDDGAFLPMCLSQLPFHFIYKTVSQYREVNFAKYLMPKPTNFSILCDNRNWLLNKLNLVLIDRLGRKNKQTIKKFIAGYQK